MSDAGQRDDDPRFGRSEALILLALTGAPWLLIALAVGLRMKLVPTGIQNFMEMVIEYFYALAEQIAGKAARSYFPWIMTIFLFVIVSNWFGLLPGAPQIEVMATLQVNVPSRLPARVVKAPAPPPPGSPACSSRPCWTAAYRR